jgi:hypothetical protein
MTINCRHYLPCLIFEHNDQLVIPAESVYAVFESCRLSRDATDLEQSANRIIAN